MYFVKTPLNSWLLACLFLIAFGSCEMDSQLSSLANTPEQGLTVDEDLQNSNDSASLRTGNIIYEETFEGPSPLSQHIHRQLAGNHSFNVVASPVLQGQKSGRFELRKGDPVVTTSGIRAEMLFERSLVNQLEKEGWYSFAVYLPSDGFAPDDDDETFIEHSLT